MILLENSQSARPFGGKSPRSRRSRGSALVEAAVIMPVMFLMLAGTMDFGRIFYTGVALASAARAGVQYASFTPGNAGNFDAIKQAAQDDAANQGLAANSITVTAKTFCQCTGTSTAITYNTCTVTTCSGSTGPPPSYSEVTVAYTFTTLLNWPGIPSTTTISRMARLRVQ